jgi:hypothetical protein
MVLNRSIKAKWIALNISHRIFDKPFFIRYCVCDVFVAYHLFTGGLNKMTAIFVAKNESSLLAALAA